MSQEYIEELQDQVETLFCEIFLLGTLPQYGAVWNVREATILDDSRTNNICESWNKSFKNLLGYNNPTIWACIEALKRDNMMACLALGKHDHCLMIEKRRHKRPTIQVNSSSVQPAPH